MVQCDIARKVDWICMANHMVYLVAGCKSDRLLPVGTGKEAYLNCSCRNYWISHGKTSGSCDNGQYQCTKAYSGEWHKAYCNLRPFEHVL